MFWKVLSGVLFISAFVFVSSAYAGKTELTTYYPSPYGEYKDVKASHSFQVPYKTVGTDKTKVKAGEIWIEPCPTGQTWNGTACV